MFGFLRNDIDFDPKYNWLAQSVPNLVLNHIPYSETTHMNISPFISSADYDSPFPHLRIKGVSNHPNP